MTLNLVYLGRCYGPRRIFASLGYSVLETNDVTSFVEILEVILIVKTCYVYLLESLIYHSLLIFLYHQIIYFDLGFLPEQFPKKGWRGLQRNL